MVVDPGGDEIGVSANSAGRHVTEVTCLFVYLIGDREGIPAEKHPGELADPEFSEGFPDPLNGIQKPRPRLPTAAFEQYSLN
jgi:hypothetical protein